MLGALSTQGGFLGNAGGLVSQYPLGLVGQIGGINKDIADNLKLKDSFGLAGAVASNVGGLLGGGTQMGNAGGLGLGAAGIGGNFIDPMTIKKVF